MFLNNGTHYNDSHIILTKITEIYEMKDITINLYYIPSRFTQIQDYHIHGFTLFNDIPDRTYIIYLNPNLTNEQLIKVLIHEMVHVNQMYNGDLYYINNRFIVYKNDTIDLVNIPYFMRSFETDAFLEERYIHNKYFKK